MRVWPAIPIIIIFFGVIPPSDRDNLIAALENPDRVSRVRIFILESQLGEIAALMQQPFPVLTHLSVSSQYRNVSALPDGFLGRSAPSLQQLHLRDIAFPALPTLLLSAGNLVSLSLCNISPTGYVSPEAMVSLVAASPKLAILCIEFNDLSSFPELIVSTSKTRAALPALRKFSFSGACKSIAGPISQALAYVNGEMITEVMPALKLLHCFAELEKDQRTPSVHNFLAVCRESGHPVTFVETKGVFDEQLRSYL
jgi:hypothetical protein